MSQSASGQNIAQAQDGGTASITNIHNTVPSSNSSPDPTLIVFVIAVLIRPLLGFAATVIFLPGLMVYYVLDRFILNKSFYAYISAYPPASYSEYLYAGGRTNFSMGFEPTWVMVIIFSLFIYAGFKTLKNDFLKKNGYYIVIAASFLLCCVLQFGFKLSLFQEIWHRFEILQLAEFALEVVPKVLISTFGFFGVIAIKTVDYLILESSLDIAQYITFAMSINLFVYFAIWWHIGDVKKWAEAITWYVKLGFWAGFITISVHYLFDWETTGALFEPLETAINQHPTMVIWKNITSWRS